MAEIAQSEFFCGAHLKQLPKHIRTQVAEASKSLTPWHARHSRDWIAAVETARKFLSKNE